MSDAIKATKEANILLAHKDVAWFSANPFHILKDGQVVFLKNSGTYKIGNGTTTLTALPFYPSITGGTWGSITGTVTDQTDLVSYLNTTHEKLVNKGAANGYTPLNSGSKIPSAYLPNSVMEYQGLWDASTNTPTLADGTGNAGDVWECNVAGSVNFGSGAITFKVGDYAQYNYLGVWEKSINSNEVVSWNGLTGAISATTSNLPEGSNLYYTSARARTANAVSPGQIAWGAPSTGELISSPYLVYGLGSSYSNILIGNPVNSIYLQLQADNGGSYVITNNTFYVESAIDIYFYTNNVPRMQILQAGSVLVNGGRMKLSGTNGTNAEFARLSFGIAGSPYDAFDAAYIAGYSVGNFGGGSELRFYTHPGPDTTIGVPTQRMSIGKSGNVLIGAGSGSFAFSVIDQVYVDTQPTYNRLFVLAPTGLEYVEVYADASNSVIESRNLSVTGGQSMYLYSAGGGCALEIYHQTSPTLKFDGNGISIGVSTRIGVTENTSGNMFTVNGLGCYGANQTATALVDIGASTTSNASLRVRSGTAPTSPNAGDVWFNGPGNGFNFYNNTSENIISLSNNTGTFTFAFDGSGGYLIPYTSGYGMYLYNASASSYIGVKGTGGLEVVSPSNFTISATTVLANYYTNTSTPGIAAGTGAGTGPTINIFGTNQQGTITITAGAVPTAGGTIVTITLSGGFTFPGSVIPVISASSDQSATDIAKITCSATGLGTWIIKARTGQALSSGGNYSFNYSVGGY